jgi:hypothetical protein
MTTRPPPRPGPGGKRAGAGRKPVLDHPRAILTRFEAAQLTALDAYAAEHKLDRSAALRRIVDSVLEVAR